MPKSRQSEQSVRPVRYSRPAAKTLFPSTLIKDWLFQEEASLVQFILLSSPQEWPIAMKVSYWEKASEFVHNYCQSSGYPVEKRTSTV